MFQWESLRVKENVYILEAVGSAFMSILCGMALIVQSSFNQRIALVLGDARGSTWLSLSLAAVLTFIASFFVFISNNSFQIQRDDPWDHLWVWTGGMIGSIILWSFTYVPSKIGMTMTFICVVLGQIIAAFVFDALGLFGVDVRIVTVKRISGVVLAMTGVILANLETTLRHAYQRSELPEGAGVEIQKNSVCRTL